MNNEMLKSSELMLDRSQGTQVESKGEDTKLYQVKEVCEISGLTRKQLYDYQKLVKPTSYDKSGYKLYNEAALLELIMVAKLRKIDVPLSVISKLLDNEITLEILVRKQIDVLEEQKCKIEKMIASATEMLKHI